MFIIIFFRSSDLTISSHFDRYRLLTWKNVTQLEDISLLEYSIVVK